jgi:glycosyltransferase involved in cell wall biosynthesis
LKIVGEGEQREQLEYMIRDMALSDVVSLEGRRSHEQIRQYFSEAELFLLTSLAEGFPNVVGEAMVAGVPFVATDTGGIREVLPETFADCIIPVGDYKCLVKKIVSRNKKRTDLLVEEGRLIARDAFSPERHAIAFREFWNNALKKTA